MFNIQITGKALTENLVGGPDAMQNSGEACALLLASGRAIDPTRDLVIRLLMYPFLHLVWFHLFMSILTEIRQYAARRCSLLFHGRARRSWLLLSRSSKLDLLLGCSNIN